MLGAAVIASCLNDSNKAVCCSYLRFPSLHCHCHPHLFHYGFNRLDKTAGVPHSAALSRPGRDKEVVKRGNKSHQMERLLFVQPSYGKLIAASRILNRCNKCWKRGILLLIGRGGRQWKHRHSPFCIWKWVLWNCLIACTQLKGAVRHIPQPYPLSSKPSRPVFGLTDKHVLCWLIALPVSNQSQVTG